MFPDTDLPLALIMEEILGWEEKPDSETDNEKSRGGEVANLSRLGLFSKAQVNRNIAVALQFFR